MNNKIIITFLMAMFIFSVNPILAGRGDDMSKAEWKKTCIENRLRKRDFSSRRNWKSYKKFCKTVRKRIRKKKN